MGSLQRHEGYLLIDNRASGDGLMESATVTCSHCHRIVVLNPDRTRPREYCSGCDHYICDGCAAIRSSQPACLTLNAVLDRQQEAAFHDEQASRGGILISLSKD